MKTTKYITIGILVIILNVITTLVFQKIITPKEDTLTTMQKDSIIMFDPGIDKIRSQFVHTMDSILKATPAKVSVLYPPQELHVNSTPDFEQVKIDSMEHRFSELSGLIKTNIISTTPPPILANPLSEAKIRMTDSYYTDISIVFRSRKSLIKGKIQQQYFSSLQYGQLFLFENSIPEFMYDFTDMKGAAISKDEAKEFLIHKSFWINSIELKDKDAIINCSLGI